MACNEFLSTLSLRRATMPTITGIIYSENFYPRSPCGERRPTFTVQTSSLLISIHALLAESDHVLVQIEKFRIEFLSTLSLRRATLVGLAAHRLRNISIHALLAESDVLCGNRHAATARFLSTLSLRRATHPQSCQFPCLAISIHALLAESDMLTSTR